jgi:hypothetical protein
MRKWLTIIFTALAIGIAAIIPTKVHAVNPVVHITVYAYIVGTPSGLTLTYVSDYEIAISWTKGVDAENTMVRGAIGRMPTSKTDGYEVYYGTGTVATDWVNIGQSAPLYYKAYSQRLDGKWEPIGTSGVANFMSMSYLWIGLVVLALVLSITSLLKKHMIMSLLSAFAWLLCTIFTYYTITTLQPQLYTGMLLFFLFCFITMLVQMYRSTRGEPIPPVVPYDHRVHLKTTMEKYREARRRL